MLANLLPGVRELRGPLVAGYLWLLFIWLVWGDKLPTKRSEVQGALGRLFDLAPLLKDFGVVAVLSVTAYLVGSLAIGLGAWVIGPVRRKFELWAMNRAGKKHLTRREEALRMGAAPPPPPPLGAVLHRDRVSARGNEQLMNWASVHGVDPRRLYEDVLRELDVVKTRLLTSDLNLHSEVDRRDTEATFRLAVVPPLAGIFLFMTFADRLLWLIGLTVVGGLVWQGLQQRREGGDLLVDAIRLTIVTPPALARLRDPFSPERGESDPARSPQEGVDPRSDYARPPLDPPPDA